MPEHVRSGIRSDSDDRDGRWWRPDLPSERRYSVANRVFERVRNAQQERINRLLLWHRLYQNSPMRGIGTKMPQNTTGERLAFNVVKSCCDSFVAKITKEQPKAWFVTSGADWDEQERAKDLDKFVEAQFYDTRFYEQRTLAWLDACIFGTGVLKPYASVNEINDDDPEDTRPKGRLVLDRVFPYELFTDEMDSMYGRPSQLWHTQRVDRMRLAWMYRNDPAKHAAIMAANRGDDNDPRTEDPWIDTVTDRLRVTEHWRLPSGSGARDGRRLLTINNATLEDEEWKYDYFPYIWFRRQHAPTGFWGISLAAELQGIQLEMNILLDKIQRSHHLLAAGHWLLENGSMISSHQIDNQIGSIIRYTGIKPELAVGMAVSPEIYQHLETLYQKAYEITGISQLSAQSQKPAGLNSGKALDTFSDIETERFSVSARLDQQAIIDASRQYIDRIKELAESVPDLAIKGQSKSSMVRLRWKDVKLEEDAYYLKLTPANAFSSDPVEKMQQIQTMTEAGWIPPKAAQRLLEFPDLEGFFDLQNASFDLVNDIADTMLRTGEYQPPEPVMQLDDGPDGEPGAISIVLHRLLVAQRAGAPEDRLELLRRFLVDAQRLAAPPPAPSNVLPGPQPPPPPPANDNGQAAPAAPSQQGPPTPGRPPGAALQ